MQQLAVAIEHEQVRIAFYFRIAREQRFILVLFGEIDLDSDELRRRGPLGLQRHPWRPRNQQASNAEEETAAAHVSTLTVL
jgi:hypothetical protein